MKVVCHMIITPNGVIAREDGRSVSSAHDWEEFCAAAKRYDNFVVGRSTFEAVGEQGFAGAACAHKVIVSSRKDLSASPAYTIVGSPQAAVELLQDKVDTLFLVGGAHLNTAFATQGLIDELALIIEPRLIGEGINLFAPTDFELSLVLKNTEQLKGGRVKITYEVS